MVKRNNNPYTWDKNPTSQPIIRRQALLEQVMAEITRGRSNYLIACRGMGKSVFLHELANALRSVPEYQVIVLTGPPTVLDVQHMVGELVEALVEAADTRGRQDLNLEKQLRRHGERQDVKRVLSAFLQAEPDIERLILLYDELDRYGGDDGRTFFNAIEDVRKTSEDRLVVFAAGGVGLVAVDSPIGSPFLSRMRDYVLEPFSRAEIIELATPFKSDGRPLTDEVIDTLLSLSGGNGLMTVYCLDRLWDKYVPTSIDVSGVFSDLHAQREIINGIRATIFSPGDALPKAPEVVWRKLTESDEKLSNHELEKLVAAHKGEHTLDGRRVLRMLRASGLIRCADDAHLQSSIEVDIIPSILTLHLSSTSEQAKNLSEQLALDLTLVLGRIHRMSIDFFYEKQRKKGQDLEPVPEATFSAMIGISLECMGWRVEREAQSGAGRTDAKATHPRFLDQTAIIEIKIWPRNDFEHIHDQVVSYWAANVTALATVMFGSTQERTWGDAYKAKCLDGKVDGYDIAQIPDFLAGHFIAPSGKSSVPKIDHFLVRLARRSKASGG